MIGNSTETYQAVVHGIQKMYDYKLSEAEAHEAARNLIGVCQLILEYKREKYLKQKQQDETLKLT